MIDSHTQVPSSTVRFVRSETTDPSRTSRRLAVVLSHPTQYYSPWFKHLAAAEGLALRIFYLWDFGVKETRDRKFGASFAWDIPLLDGYENEFVPNRSPDPGTHHFSGLDNPDLVRRLIGWKPDTILLFGYQYRSHFRVICTRRLRGKPLLFRGDSHELCPSAGLRQIAGRTARRLLFHRFDAFLAVGKANAEYIAKSGVPASRIHLVPHCVDNERFRAGAADARAKAREWKRELGMPEEDMVVLFAGKFEEKKRPLDLLNAFRDARNRRNGPVKNKVSLLYVGSGPQEQLLREEAARHADLPVFFAPFQNQTEMPKAYAAADLFVLPSFGRGETWGLAVNEAMNLGRPVIVSSHVGCGPDLVVPGETGWTFPAGETGSLSACLSEALEKPETLRKMGEAARRRVEHYSYASATRSLLKVLEAVG